MRTLFRYEREHIGEFIEAEPTYPELSFKQAILGYVLAAIVVVAAGIALPFIGEQIALSMGWAESFVGTLFIAAVTSTPEAVVTISALRLGAIDMAVGNLLGSNLFNIAILALDDLFYFDGPLLHDIDKSHLASAFSAIMMSGLAIIGLMVRPRSRILRTVNWVSIFLLVIYLFNLLFLYLASVP
jgi:cation:H+ antiporter